MPICQFSYVDSKIAIDFRKGRQKWFPTLAKKRRAATKMLLFSENRKTPPWRWSSWSANFH
jgi:hypothetical protein